MTETALNKLKFPIGPYRVPDVITDSILTNWISTIQEFPLKMTALVKDLSEIEKNWQYRPNGWTIKQVVHHCADSHLNAYTRFKLCLTEEEPEIRPYFEAQWAELIDGKDNDLTDSLQLLNGLHKRWSKLLIHLNEAELNRRYYHPEHQTTFNLKETIGNYAWHSNHHLAHIQQALHHQGQF